jgi:hypothetical protein
MNKTVIPNLFLFFLFNLLLNPNIRSQCLSPNAPTFEIAFHNLLLTAPNKIEFDIELKNISGLNNIALMAFPGSFVINPSFLNGGTPTMFTYISPTFQGLVNNFTNSSYLPATNTFSWAHSPLSPGVVLPTNTWVSLVHVIISNSVFFNSSCFGLCLTPSLTLNTSCGIYNPNTGIGLIGLVPSSPTCLPQTVTVPQVVLNSPIMPASTTANITWNAILGSTTYQVAYKKLTASAWSTITTIGSSINLTGLSASTAYLVKIRNNNAQCNTMNSYGGLSSFTTLGLPCAYPSALTASFLVGNKIKFDWNLISGVNQYNLQYKLSGASSWTSVILTSNTPTYTTPVLPSGTYDYRIRNRCLSTNVFSAYGNVGSISFKKKETVLVEDEVINIFPNPTSDVLNIEITSALASNVHVKLYDLTGRIINQAQAKLNVGINPLAISMAQFPKGYYLIQVVSDEKMIATRKVMRE